MSDLEARLTAIIRADPGLMHVLTTVRGLGLNDWRVFSGAVYQSVWNVHLWFEARFGEPYDALNGTDEALAGFVAPAFAVGVRLEADDTISVAAPFGLEDVFSMTLRPNPNRPLAKGWARAVTNASARWPELTIIEPEIA